MLRKLSILVITLAAAVFSGCGKQDGKDVVHYLGVGDPLPSFRVVLSDGTAVTNKSLKGNVSILVFFGPGCPDCKWQFDELQAFYGAYPELCSIVAVSRGMSDEVPSYMEKNGYTFPWSAQKDRTLYERFSNMGIPSMYVSDRNGYVRFVHFDDCMASMETLKDEVFATFGL